MRIQIIIDQAGRLDRENIVFSVDGFPAAPHKGDRMNLAVFAADMEVGLDRADIEFLESHSFIVDFVSWQKDEKGIFLWVFCSGE